MLRLNRPDSSNSNGLSFAAGGAGSKIVICHCLPKVEGCFTFWTLWGCCEWASGLSLATQQSLGYIQVAWIGRLYKADFVKEGHVQSAQVRFPLLLNKALTWGQQTWIWPFYKLRSFKEGMFRVGKWAFPCC